MTSSILFLIRRYGLGLTILRAFLVVCIIGFPYTVCGMENGDRVEGVVRPQHRVKLNSQITGMVKAILVKDGARVRKGDILIRLDDTLQKAAVEKASLQVADVARIKTAELRQAEAKVVLEQMKSAFQKEAASEWELRRAGLQVNLAEMEVKAEAEEKSKNCVLLAVEKERLAMHLIKAPIDGIVRKVLVEPGQTVSQSDPVLEAVDLSSLKAEFFLPIACYGKLKVGQNYALIAGEPVNRQLTARLETADKTLDSASQTFRAVFRLSNAKYTLPSGFQVFFPWRGIKKGER